jgi:quinol monooxygenase YgiN
MILVLGEARVKPGMEAEALALSLEHVRRSRWEEGCISHDVSIHAEDSSKLVFIEYWADKPSLLAHFALAASKQFMQDLIPMLSNPPQLNIYEAEPVET